MKKAKYSIVIPIFNASQTIEELLLRLDRVMKKNKLFYEVVFINDGSSDKSEEILSKIARKRFDVKYIELMRNFGQHNALICGINYAQGDFVITMDDDLQHPPEEIIKLVNKINLGQFDLVYGEYENKQHSSFRNWGSKIGSRLIASISGTKSKITAFRIFNKIVRDKIIKRQYYSPNLGALISAIVSPDRIGRVKIKHNRRKVGKSSYNTIKLWLFFQNLIINYTTAPLTAIFYFGLIVLVLSFAYAIILLINHIYQIWFIGNYGLIYLSICFFSGLILSSIGLSNLYLSRIYWTVLQRPQYEIRKVVMKENKKTQL